MELEHWISTPKVAGSSPAGDVFAKTLDITELIDYRSGMILYHGTSTAHQEKIFRDGLLPRNETGVSNWAEAHGGYVESKSHLVYLTLAYPVYFAFQAASEGSDLLILKVEVDEDALYPDEDFLAYVAKKQGIFDLPLAEILPLVEPLDNQGLALTSLKHNGIAAVEKVLPEQIVDHRVIPSSHWQTIMSIGGDSMPIPMNFLILGDMYRRTIDILFEGGEEAAVETVRERWKSISG